MFKHLIQIFRSHTGMSNYRSLVPTNLLNAEK